MIFVTHLYYSTTLVLREMVLWDRSARHTREPTDPRPACSRHRFFLMVNRHTFIYMKLCSFNEFGIYFLRAQPPNYNDNNNSSLVYYIFSDIIIMAHWVLATLIHCCSTCTSLEPKLILVPIHVPFNYWNPRNFHPIHVQWCMPTPSP